MKLLCTLGPASLKDQVIADLEEVGASLFRLNLSHVELDKVAETVSYIQSRTGVPVCLDTEGSQELHRVPGVKVRTHITPKDAAAFAIGRDLGVSHLALSFAHSAEDVDEVRGLSLPGATVIAKVECLAGLAHLHEIARHADALLIDRGDLSRQVPVERIPLTQKGIIAAAKRARVPVYVATNLMESMTRDPVPTVADVYVATNLMESMTRDPVPTVAEANDVFNTLLDGADGLVLAGETAIGKHPVECARMIKRLVHVYWESVDRDALGWSPTYEVQPTCSEAWAQ
jgi:pyruvate kinase